MNDLMHFEPNQRLDFSSMDALCEWMEKHGWEIIRWQPMGNIRLRRKIAGNQYQFLDLERVA